MKGRVRKHERASRVKEERSGERVKVGVKEVEVRRKRE